ncbi:hypothetical protein [Paraburkholderia ferrariae]|uniref:Uncharacterized protein n=1 Tax=Paraburkholderia ferrariae TaxID=386056 RepID=A0ABU9RNK6_9BURK
MASSLAQKSGAIAFAMPPAERGVAGSIGEIAPESDIPLSAAQLRNAPGVLIASNDLLSVHGVPANLVAVTAICVFPPNTVSAPGGSTMEYVGAFEY